MTPGAIWQCIAGASAGSTIVVPAGEYQESILIDKEIALVAEDGVCLTSVSGKAAITLQANNCVVRGFRISSDSSAVVFAGGNALVENCSISALGGSPALVVAGQGSVYLLQSSVSSQAGAGIYTRDSANVELNASQVVSQQSAGIAATGSGRVRLVAGASVSKCGDAGIVIMEQASLYLNQVTINENAGDGVELNTSSQNNEITASAITGSANGIAVKCNGSGALRLGQSSAAQCKQGVLAAGGFSVTLTGCDIADMNASALVAATAGGKVTVVEGSLHGRCKVAIAASGNGTVRCEGVKVTDLPGTGATVFDGGILQLEKCEFNAMGEMGIEAHGSGVVEINETTVTENQVGIMMQGNIKGFLKASQVTGSAVACLHAVDGLAEFTVETTAFLKSKKNGVNIKNATISFQQCAMNEHAGSSIEVRGSETKARLTACSLGQSDKGATLRAGCNVVLDGCHLITNQTGLLVSEACKIEMSNCVIGQNALAGAQLVGEGTDVSLQGCAIHSTAQGPGLLVAQGANARLTACQVQQNATMNICFQGGKGVLSGCTCCSSGQGIGTYITQNSVVAISQSVLYGDAQAAIHVSEGADCTCEQCDITGCAVGVMFAQNGKGTFRGNRVHDNTSTGFWVADGSPTISGNEISNHANYAIGLGAGATPDTSGNTYSGNPVEVFQS